MSFIGAPRNILIYRWEINGGLRDHKSVVELVSRSLGVLMVDVRDWIFRSRMPMTEKLWLIGLIVWSLMLPRKRKRSRISLVKLSPPRLKKIIREEIHTITEQGWRSGLALRQEPTTSFEFPKANDPAMDIADQVNELIGTGYSPTDAINAVASTPGWSVTSVSSAWETYKDIQEDTE